MEVIGIVLLVWRVMSKGLSVGSKDLRVMLQSYVWPEHYTS